VNFHQDIKKMNLSLLSLYFLRNSVDCEIKFQIIHPLIYARNFII